MHGSGAREREREGEEALLKEVFEWRGKDDYLGGKAEACHEDRKEGWG
jgi:hypothetical protein